ncbi:hypothetical protein HpDR134_03340 [Helicobacter pylori]
MILKNDAKSLITNHQSLITNPKKGGWWDLNGGRNKTKGSKL